MKPVQRGYRLICKQKHMVLSRYTRYESIDEVHSLEYDIRILNYTEFEKIKSMAKTHWSSRDLNIYQELEEYMKLL